MWLIRYRNWRREAFNIEIKAGRKERLYLEKQPWLRQLVPMGRTIWRDGIKVETADVWFLCGTARQSQHRSRGMFLIDGDGNILTKIRRRLRWGDETVYKALVRLGDKANDVKFAVKVYGNDTACGMLITRFPSKEPTVEFVQRIIAENEQRRAEAAEDGRRERQARIAKETAAAREEVERAFAETTGVALPEE